AGGCCTATRSRRRCPACSPSCKPSTVSSSPSAPVSRRSRTCSCHSRGGRCVVAERRSPLVELTKARVREFYREPGAVFWVFGFPVIMVVVLGLAFREREPEKPRVSVEATAPHWVRAALEAEGFRPLSFEGE